MTNETPPITWTDHTTASRTALVLPAMGVPASYYQPFTEHLAEAGFHVGVTELRGQGDYGPPPNRHRDHGFYELVAEDLVNAVAQAHQRHPATSTLLIGHSLGGHLATLYAGLDEELPIDGIVTIAADSPYYRAFGSCGPRVLAGALTASGAARLLGYLPGQRVGLGDQPRTLMREWAALSRTGSYRIAKLPDIDHRVADAKIPVLAIAVEGDAIAPPTSIAHLKGKFNSELTEQWELTKAVAGSRIDHIRWVKSAGPVAQRISQWCDAQ